MSKFISNSRGLINDINTAVCYGKNCKSLNDNTIGYTRTKKLADATKKYNNRFVKSLHAHYASKADIYGNRYETDYKKIRSFKGDREKQTVVLGYITLVLVLMAIVTLSIPCDKSKNACYIGTTITGNIIYLAASVTGIYTFSTLSVNASPMYY